MRIDFEIKKDRKDGNKYVKLFHNNRKSRDSIPLDYLVNISIEYRKYYKDVESIKNCGNKLFKAIIESKYNEILQNTNNQEIILNVNNQEILYNIPFEIMYDGNCFLAEKYTIYRTYNGKKYEKYLELQKNIFYFNPIMDRDLDDSNDYYEELVKKLEKMSPYFLYAKLTSHSSHPKYEYFAKEHKNDVSLSYIYTHGNYIDKINNIIYFQWEDINVNADILFKDLRNNYLIYCNTCYSAERNAIENMIKNDIDLYIGNLHTPDVDILKQFAENFLIFLSEHYTSESIKDKLSIPLIFCHIKSKLIEEKYDHNSVGSILSIVLYKKEKNKIIKTEKSKRFIIGLFTLLSVLIFIVVLNLFQNNINIKADKDSSIFIESDNKLIAAKYYNNRYIFELNMIKNNKFRIKINNSKYKFCYVYNLYSRSNISLIYENNYYNNKDIFIPDNRYFEIDNFNNNEYLIILLTKSKLKKKVLNNKSKNKKEIYFERKYWSNFIINNRNNNINAKPVKISKNDIQNFIVFFIQIKT